MSGGWTCCVRGDAGLGGSGRPARGRWFRAGHSRTGVSTDQVLEGPGRVRGREQRCWRRGKTEHQRDRSRGQV